MSKTIFLSDIHIGSNAPTNWFQIDVHKVALQNTLKYIESIAEEIEDVVVLGDWFDFWIYGAEKDTPSLENIMDANRELFISPPGQGSFAGVMDRIKGCLRYINGNHDMTLSLSQINEWFEKQHTDFTVYPGVGDDLNLKPQDNLFYKSKNGKIYGEHGHLYDLMNKPFTEEENIYAPLPVGYYVTRSVAEYVLGELKEQKKQNVAMLPGSGDPGFKDFGLDIKVISTMIEDVFDEQRIPNLAEIVINTLTSFTQSGPLSFKMDWMGGGNLSSFKVPAYFEHMLHSAKIIEALEELTATASLTSFGKNFLNSHKDIRVMVMGHTHKFEMLYPKHKDDQVYINCGFNCADKPDMLSGKQNLTFVEITEEPGSSITIQGKILDYEAMSVRDWQEPSIINWNS